MLIPKRQSRKIQLSDNIYNDDGSINISFSSELPVERSYGIEVLSHEPGAMDLTRAAQGLPVLDNHNQAVQIGKATNIHLDTTDKRGKASIRFGNSVRAKEVGADVKDGIADGVSFGYEILDYKIDYKTTPVTVNVTRYMPYEISIVPVAADWTVGVGRSAELDKEEFIEVPDEEVTSKEINTVTETTIEEPVINTLNEERSFNANTIKETILEETHKMEPKDVRSKTLAIRAFAEKLNLTKEADEMLASERSFEDIQDELVKLVASRQKPIESKSFEGNDLKGYSVSKAIRAMASGDYSKCGLEREASRELGRKSGKDTVGFFIPAEAFRAANTMNTATAGQGQEFVKFPQYGGFIETLRPACRVLQLGAQHLPGLTQNYIFVKQTSAASTYWVSENPGADVTDTKIGLATATMSPKTLKALLTYTRTQLQQSPEAFDGIVMNELVKQHAVAVDAVAINGSGAAGQPLGLLGTAGVQVNAIGTNGGAISSNVPKILGLKTLVNTVNGLSDSCAFFTTPGIQGVLESTVPAGLTYASAPVWSNNKLYGYTAATSSNMPSTLVKGASGAVCHAVVFGDWSQVLIGEFGPLEITPDPYTLAGQDVFRVISSHQIDIGVTRPNAFAVINDALAS